MAGYDHAAGMSNNAVAAYAGGRTTLSNLTLDDLRQAGLDIPLTFARWLAREGHWSPCEWHHTGGTWYNRSDFYDPDDLAELINEGELDLAALRQEYADSHAQSDNAQGVRVRGEYAVWGGPRKRPRLERWESFTGVLRGSFIYIDGGGKKKAGGNWMRYEVIV